MCSMSLTAPIAQKLVRFATKPKHRGEDEAARGHEVHDREFELFHSCTLPAGRGSDHRVTGSNVRDEPDGEAHAFSLCARTCARYARIRYIPAPKLRYKDGGRCAAAVIRTFFTGESCP